MQAVDHRNVQSMHCSASEVQIIRLYDQGESIRRISSVTGICTATIRRILITHGVTLRGCPQADAIASLHCQGMDVQQIADALKITPKTVRAYLPYTKGTYVGDKSTNAQRIAACRARKKEATDHGHDQGTADGCEHDAEGVC